MTVPKRLCVWIMVLVAPVGLCAQECPSLTAPLNGSANVPVDAALTWNTVTGVTGYIVSVGTAPGGTDILSRRGVGSAASYTPPLGWPENTQLYVTITLFLLNNPEIACPAGSFTTQNVTTAPQCTQVNSPADGATNVNATAPISWDYAPTATGYSVTMGTAPGSNDLFFEDVGNTLSYDPPSDLPANTLIYVQVVPYNENGPATSCPTSSFTTAEAVPLPNCTQLTTPLNGEMNVPLSPPLAWAPVPGAQGYRLTIGSSPTTADVLNNTTINATTVNVINFEPNKTYFVTIVPFNATGEAIGCAQESFSTILGCGPYYDSTTQELTYLNPVIDFPSEIGLCLGQDDTTFSSTDIADGFRWYRVENNDRETVIGSNREVRISSPGTYRYEAYAIVTQDGNTIECPSSQVFTVSVSEAPEITDILIAETATGLRLETLVRGSGNYEFALDSSDGPYQNSAVFNQVAPGTHTVYVRDPRGCGTDEKTVSQDLTLEGFPSFFTPNGDGINDYWQFVPPRESGETNLVSVFIFDRYGRFLVQIDPENRGWNGTINGQNMPEADYWYRAVFREQKEIKGHFTLKR